MLAWFLVHIHHVIGEFGIVSDLWHGAQDAWNAATGGLSDILHAIWKIIKDPFGWLLHIFFPTDVMNEMIGYIGCSHPGKTGGSTAPLNSCASSIYYQYFMWLKPVGIVVAGFCAFIRIMRTLFDERGTGPQMIIDNLMRFGAVFLILQSGILWEVMARIVDFSTTAAWSIAIGFTIKGLTTAGGDLTGSADGGSGLTTLINGIVGAVGLTFSALADPIAWISWIILLIGLGYMAMLMILRSVMLAFAAVTAPVAFATLAFEFKNRFFQWWLEIFTGALLIPLCIAVGMGFTAGTLILVDSKISPLSHFLGVGIAMGGIWFTGKMVHQLAWRGFSHGGFMGGMTALSTAIMAAPNAAAEGRVIAGVAGGQGLADKLFPQGSLAQRLADGSGARLMGWRGMQGGNPAAASGKSGGGGKEGGGGDTGGGGGAGPAAGLHGALSEGSKGALSAAGISGGQFESMVGGFMGGKSVDAGQKGALAEGMVGPIMGGNAGAAQSVANKFTGGGEGGGQQSGAAGVATQAAGQASQSAGRAESAERSAQNASGGQSFMPSAGGSGLVTPGGM